MTPDATPVAKKPTIWERAREQFKKHCPSDGRTPTTKLWITYSSAFFAGRDDLRKERRKKGAR
jgi:hypothetical protein